jgi:hypothetical protein
MADDLFESIVFVERAYPDDIGLWPGSARTAAYTARDNLLGEEPRDRFVIAERSYCIGEDHERWPNPVPENLRINGLTHALVYEIHLNKPIAAING